MSGWLDLIGIGIDVAQSHQIYKAREELQQLQAGAEEAALHKAVLEMMRNFVFEIAQDIKALEDKMQTAPQQVYVVARALEWRLQDSGISPDIFSEFNDKEYVQQTFTKIRTAVQQSKALLSQEQLTQAETAVGYIAESGLLNQAIETKSAFEELQSTEPEWNRLSKQAGKASSMKTLGCLGLFLTFSVVPVSILIVVSLIYSINDTLGAISRLLGIGAWLVCLVGSVILMAKIKPIPYQQMKVKRESLQSKIMKQDDWKKAISLWGNLSSQGYRDIQTTRANFLRGIFGQVEGFNKFLPSAD